MAMTSDRLDVVRPADHVPGPKQGNWTYSHYAALPDDGQRYEVIDGVLYMAPAPDDEHQDAAGNFFYYLKMHIHFAGLGKVRISPYDVQLAPGVVVQPDVLVVLNAHLDRITHRGLVGAPDLVIEVASPSTATFDRRKKYTAYESAGVPEYWIVDDAAQTIEVLTLENGVYTTLGIFIGKATLPSKVVPEIAAVQVEQFFAF
jgi:Uma2 family endonuclease